MLRSIPSKLGGVFILFFSILILFSFNVIRNRTNLVFNWIDYKFKFFLWNDVLLNVIDFFFSYKKEFFFWFFLVNCILLGIIGGKPIDYPYLIFGRLFTFFYFYYFFVLLYNYFLNYYFNNFYFYYYHNFKSNIFHIFFICLSTTKLSTKLSNSSTKIRKLYIKFKRRLCKSYIKLKHKLRKFKYKLCKLYVNFKQKLIFVYSLFSFDSLKFYLKKIKKSLRKKIGNFLYNFIMAVRNPVLEKLCFRERYYKFRAWLRKNKKNLKSLKWYGELLIYLWKKIKENFSFKLVFSSLYSFFYFLIIKLIPNIIKHIYYILKFFVKLIKNEILFYFLIFKLYKKHFKILWKEARAQNKIFSRFYFINFWKKFFCLSWYSFKQVYVDLAKDYVGNKKILFWKIFFAINVIFAIKGAFTLCLALFGLSLFKH